MTYGFNDNKSKYEILDGVHNINTGGTGAETYENALDNLSIVKRKATIPNVGASVYTTDIAVVRNDMSGVSLSQGINYLRDPYWSIARGYSYLGISYFSFLAGGPVEILGYYRDGDDCVAVLNNKTNGVVEGRAQWGILVVKNSILE